MNFASDQAMYELAGWTLIHFLWQGVLVAAAVWLLLQMFSRRAANLRYLLLCGGLASLAIFPAVTAVWLAASWQTPQLAEATSALDDTNDSRTIVTEFGTVLKASNTLTSPKQTAELENAETTPAETTPVELDERKSAAAFSIQTWIESVREWSPRLIFFWAIGVLILSLRLTVGWIRTQRIKANGRHLESTALTSKMYELCNRLGVRQVVRLCQTDDILTPTVIGWIKPVVLLPASAISGLTMDQISAILAHELAHIKRHDYFVNLLQSVVEVLLFYHPAVWWISREIRQERENCCDDLALQVCSNRRDYIEALLQLEHQRNCEGSLAMAASGGALLQRVSRMLGQSQSSLNKGNWFCGLILLVIAGVVLSCMLPEQQTIATERARTQEHTGNEGSDDATTDTVEMVDFKFMVVDPDGEPIAGAKLHVSASQDKPPLAENNNLVTGNDGSVTQEMRKTTTRIRVWCVAEGFTSMYANWEPEYFSTGRQIPKDFTFILYPGSSIGGRILDSDGEPISGARVQVNYRSGGIPPLGKRQRYNTWGAAPVTDEDGRWVLDNVPPGDDVEVSLTINHPDYASDEQAGGLQKQQSISMRDLANLSANIVMKKGARIQGTITEAKSGKPITDAVVVLGDNPYHHQRQETRPSEKGQYRLPPMKPGKKRVTVMAPGFQPESRIVDMRPEMEPTDFQLKPGKKLQIRFVDPDGNPVPNTYVRVEKWRDSKAMYNHRHPNVLETKIPGISDANGLYTWNWAPADPVTFNFNAKKFAAKRGVPLAAADKPHEVVMNPELYVSGTVHDEDGEALKSFTVVPMTVLSGGAHERRDRALLGNDGFFEITTDREDAGFQVKIEATGYQTHITRVFRLGEKFEPLDITMKKAEPLEYVVIDVDGQPAASADLLIAFESQRTMVDIRTKDRSGFDARKWNTDEDGKIELEPPHEPRTLIAYSADGYAEVADLPDRPAKKIRLQKWFDIHGDVSVEGEFDSAHIYAWPIRFIHGKTWHINQLIVNPTKADGQFRMKDMPRMPASLMFSRNGKVDPRGRRYTVAVEPKSDSVALEFPCKVTGQVLISGSKSKEVARLKSEVALVSKSNSINVPTELAKIIKKNRLSADNREQVVEFFTKTDNQDVIRAYSMCFDEYSIRLDQEGKFDFQLVRPGKYELTVKLNPDYEKYPFLPMGEFKKTIEVKRSGTDLGEIKVATFPVPKPGTAIDNLLFKNRKNGLPSWLSAYQGKHLLMDLWKPEDDQSKVDARKLKEVAKTLDHDQVAILSLHTYNRTDGERMPKSLPANLDWTEGQVEINKLREFRKTIGALTPQHYVLLDAEGKFVTGGNLETIGKAMIQLGLSK